MNIITSIFGSAFLVLIGIIGYFLRSRLDKYEEADRRLEGKLERVSEKIDVMVEKVSNLSDRVSRIEGFMLQQRQ
jgi:hypothetical protein